MTNVINKLYYPIKEMTNGNEKKRSYYLDNLKFILIVLVVISHFALKLAYIPGIKYLMHFIYIFHMPCFVFINGYLSKKMNAGGKLRVEKILVTIWMYLLFKFGDVILAYLFQEKVQLSLFKDSSAPWYLFALSIWYLSVPFLERFKAKYMIIGSLVLGLLVGYVSSIYDIFSLSRVFVFYPFFAIGFYLSESKFEDFLDKRIRVPALILLVTVFSSIVIFWRQICPVKDIIYGGSPYKHSLGELASYGFIIRGIWYLLVITVCASVILLVPRCKLFFTDLGKRTMQIYMTHIWIRNALVYSGFFAIIKSGPRYLPILVLLGSILLAFLLANIWLKKLFDLLMSPKLFQFLLKKD